MASAQQCRFYFYRVICGLVLYLRNPISSTSTCIFPSLSLQGGEKKNWWGWQQIHHQSEWEQFQTVNPHEELLQGLNQTHPWPVKSYLPDTERVGYVCLLHRGVRPVDTVTCGKSELFSRSFQKLNSSFTTIPWMIWALWLNIKYTCHVLTES